MIGREKRAIVLLIERDPVEGTRLSRLLRDGGKSLFELELVDSINAALERLGHGGVDVLLLDLSTADSVGLGALDTLIADAAGLPVVVLTQDGGQFNTEVLARGADAYVSKDHAEDVVLEYALLQAVERSRNKQQSAYNDKRLRALIERSKDGVAVLAPDGRVLFKSPSFRQIFHFEEEDNLGCSGFGFLHPDDLPAMMDLFAKVTANPGVAMSCEARTKDKEGEWYYVEATATNFIDDPAVGGIVVNVRDISERKQAEEARRLQDEFYRRVIENAPVGTLVVDAQSAIRYGSASFPKLLGYGEEENIGESIFEFVHPEDAGKAAELFMEAIGNPGGSAQAEVRALHKNGTWRWIEAVATNRIDDAAVGGVVINLHDVTDRKQADEVLKLKEAFFRKLIEKSNDGVLVLDAQGVMKFGGSSFERLLGYLEDEKIGESAFSYIHPDDAPAATAVFLKLAATPGGADRVEVRALHKDGTWRWLEVIGTNHLDDPAVEGVILNLRDITDRKQVDEAIRLKEEFYRKVIEKASDAIMLVDSQAVLKYESPSFSRILGYEENEKLGECSFNYVHPDDLPQVINLMTEAMLDPHSSVHLEFRGLHKDGSWRWLEVIGTNHLQDPAVNGLVLNLRDITERKRIEKQTKRRREIEAAMAAVSAKMANALDIDEAINESLDICSHLIGASRAHVLAFNKDKDMAAATHEWCAEGISSQMDLLQGFGTAMFPWWTAKLVAGEPVMIDDVSKMPEEARAEQELLQLTRTKSALAFPLYSAGELYGFIDFEKMEEVTEWTPVDVIWIGIMCETVGGALDRKRHQEELQQREWKFKQLFTNVNDVVLFVDLAGNLLDVNDRVEDMLGYTRDEMLGRNLADMNLFFQETLAAMAQAFAESVIAQKATQPFSDVPMIHKDGHTIHVEISSCPITDPQGQLEGFVDVLRDITERKAAEESVRQSEQRYRLLAENVSDIIFTMNNSLQITYISPSATRILGFSTEKLMSMALDETMTSESYQALMKFVAETVFPQAMDPSNQSKAWTIDVEALRKDGSTIWLEETMSLVRDESGQMVGIQGVSRDVTERKKASAALEEVHKRYRAFFNNPLYLLIIHDAFGRFLDINDVALSGFGYTREELLNQYTFADIIYPDDMPLAFKAISQGMNQGYMDEPIELRVYTKSREIRWLEVYGVPIQRPPLEYLSITICLDITERKKMEQSLRETEKAFRAIFENPMNLVFVNDDNGQFIDANDAALQLLGYTRDDVQNLNFVQVAHPDDLQAALVALSVTLTKGYMDKPIQVRVRSKSGEIIWVEAYAYGLPYGGKRCHLAIARDITERKRAEEMLKKTADALARQNTELEVARRELADLNRNLEEKVKDRTTQVEDLIRQKDTFIRQLGHDLKSPLTPLVTLLPLVKEDEENPEHIELLEVAIQNVNYMRDLVTKTLKMARLTTVASIAEFESTDLAQVVRSVLGRRKMLAKGKGVTIENRIDNAIMLQCDQLALEELMDNLITNAVKYTPEGGTVTLDVVKDEPYVTVSVSDNGIGMTPEQLSHLFEEFYKVDKSKHEMDSSGLGLSICKRIIEQRGGKIWAESSGLGEGSTFYFVLKMSEAKTATPESAAEMGCKQPLLKT